ncbi:MAG: autotransporter outer membrane beta-barrel domain-containing protein, partial [Saezia sp.]
KGQAAQLSGSSHADGITTSIVGVKGAWQLNTSSNLYAAIGWQHNFGDKAPEAKLNFLGGDRYTLKGVEMNTNSAIIGFGANYQIKPNMSLSLGYEGQFGNQSRDHAGKVLFEMRF